MIDLVLAVEQAVPADHPASWLAVPLGILFMCGSVYLLLWSNYGARKAGAIYGVAIFGFSFLLGIFYWLGGPGTPAGLGISHLPGQSGDHYAEQWHAFEEGSERAEFFADGIADPDAFVTPEEFTGVAGEDEETIQADPAYAALSGSVGQAEGVMEDQFLPVDENSVAQIGSERRQGYEDVVADEQPEDAAGRAQPFYTAEATGDIRVFEDPDTGVLLAVQTFHTVATFTDDEDVPLDPIPVGEETNWFAFYDPGAEWIPSALWTGISLVLFLLSLAWLDRQEMQEKKRNLDEVAEAEDPAVPIAQ